MIKRSSFATFKERIVKAPRMTATAFKVIWRKLPRIAIYTLAFFVIFSVGDRLYYNFEPASHFVQYTSFIVQNANEGQDVPFTLCRTHRGDYDVSGVRSIYVIPQGKTVKEKVFVHNDRLNGVIGGQNCANYYVKESDYHFTAGSYEMTINTTFTVKYGYEKQIQLDSNVFQIKTATPNAAVQEQLNNLQQQIDLLQSKLRDISNQYAIPMNSKVQPAPTAMPTNGEGNSSGAGTLPSTVTPVTQPAPVSKGTHQECSINLLGVKLNCRDVPN